MQAQLLSDVPAEWFFGGAAVFALAVVAFVLWRGRDDRPTVLGAAPRRPSEPAAKGSVDAALRARDGDAADEPEDEGAPVLAELRGITREYVDASGDTVVAVRDADLAVHEGEMVGIIGPSGQGKSTLLNVLGGLDVPTRGEVLFRGERLPNEEGDELLRYRSDHVAYVFQDLNLVTHLSAIDNAALPLICKGARRAHALEVARGNLERLGMGDLLHRRPNQLSGGQQQRVAIARAFTSEAALILADEPTGSLDPETARDVMDAFAELSREGGRTVVLVTHNTSLARRTCDRVLQCTTSGLVPVRPRATKDPRDAEEALS